MGDNPYAAEELAKRELEEANAQQQTEPAIDEKKETLIGPEDEQQQRNLAICKEALESSLKDQDKMIKEMKEKDEYISTVLNMYNTDMKLKEHEIDRLKNWLMIWRCATLVMIFILFLVRFFGTFRG